MLYGSNLHGASTNQVDVRDSDLVLFLHLTLTTLFQLFPFACKNYYTLQAILYFGSLYNTGFLILSGSILRQIQKATVTFHE